MTTNASAPPRATGPETGAAVPAGIEPEQLRLLAADGYPLAALRYTARGPVRGHLVMAGATGVPQRFYRPFAEFAAAQGYTTLTLDYRGIGLSKPRTLKGFRMAYLDWAHLDLTAAVDQMASDDVPLFMVGHSFGGHAFGLLPNHDRVARFYTFATGAGWHGWMPPLERVRVLLMWRVIGPLITRWKGYLAWSKLGMGEDLPLNVYRDWKHWCRFPRYFFDDPEMGAEVSRRFDLVRTPIVAANALDDLWAPPASRDAFMAGYRNAPLQQIDIDPRASGLGPIGHMGYFRRKSQPLWQEALAWFQQHPQPAGVHLHAALVAAHGG
ncbi:MAG: alpha/beta fold hydrolase [Ramlibacter sp.]|jgi:predicted alpha/beta hydrolase|nr:alpha/beta fold hydrolase [Ramlibacter sp.]